MKGENVKKKVNEIWTLNFILEWNAFSGGVRSTVSLQSRKIAVILTYLDQLWTKPTSRQKIQYFLKFKLRVDLLDIYKPPPPFYRRPSLPQHWNISKLTVVVTPKAMVHI